MAFSGLQWGINMTERYFYSATTNGFYPYSLFENYRSAGSWPEDAVEISERWYSYLLDGMSAGKIINANEDGQPVLSEPIPPTEQELRAVTEVRKVRLMQEVGEKIDILQDAVELGISTEEEERSLIAWRGYRVQLSRVSPDNPVWPELPE